MGKDMRFLESPSNEKEAKYRFKVKWNDLQSSIREIMETGELKHYGPGEKEITGLDTAWEYYQDLKKDPDYVKVRLYKIEDDGSERIW